MADQNNRGGQKTGPEHEGQGKKHRGAHTGEAGPERRDMKEDARRGQQSDQGGYHGQRQNG